MKRQTVKKPQVADTKVAASITLYLALVLVIVLVLICTLIESGRMQAIQAKAKSVTYMGLDSVFSEYARPVFEDYGVMLLWCRDDAFLKRFEGYVSKNLENEGTSLLPVTDLFGLRYQEANLMEANKITDHNGRAFEEQVGEYMKYYLAEEAAEKLLEHADLFEQGKKVQKFMDKINKHQKVFVAVEKSVGKMKEKITSVQKMAADPARYIGRISDSLEKFERTQEDAFLNDVAVNENELLAVRYKLTDSFDAIKTEADRYHENAAKAEAAVKDMEEELDLERGDLPEDVYESLQEEITDIRNKSGDAASDFYRIEENLNQLDSYQEKVSSLDGLINTLNGEITAENIQEIRPIAEAYQESFADFDLSGLSVNYDTERVEKESSDFLKVIQDIFENGILSYIAGDVSEKKVELKELPSGMVGKKNTEHGPLLQDGVKKAVFSEYISTHFGRFTDLKEETALSYETEYILSGKASDRENLQAVMNEIILLRTGCNLISLLKDPGKKAEALGLATAIVGFTGMPVLIKIMELLILHAWALAESLVDAKVLFNGQKVPLIKRNDEWSLSLQAVKNFSKAAIDGKGSKTGTSYEDYLRMLLLMQNKQMQIFRTMDVIQLNMIRKENETFRMKDCIVNVELEAEYAAPALFVTFPFVRRYVGFGSGSYGFAAQQTYSY